MGRVVCSEILKVIWGCLRTLYQPIIMREIWSCINVSKERTNSLDTPSRFDKQDVLRSRADPIIDDIK
jgi:hypothetical protein